MSKPLILIAENNPDALATLTEYFQKKGYRVLGVSNPPDAIQMVEKHQPDLVISDLRLTDDTDSYDTSGLEVVREATGKGIPAILNSTSSWEFPGVVIVRKGTHKLHTKVRKMIG